MILLGEAGKCKHAASRFLRLINSSFFQPFMRRSKFRLLASFLEATMLSVHDSPIEFEVSIGNYGNKLDNSFNPSSSTTPPTNPVFDGEKYYFLPWSGTKPCIRLDSHWEDITFRLGVLNKLLKACHRLVSIMLWYQKNLLGKVKFT